MIANHGNQGGLANTRMGNNHDSQCKPYCTAEQLIEIQELGDNAGILHFLFEGLQLSTAVLHL